MPAQSKKASGSKGGAAPKKAAQGAQAEKRLDPHSGKTLTLSELETMYRGRYGKSEIDQYWKHECKVVKAEAKAKADAEATKTKEDAERKAKEEEEAKNEVDANAKAEEVQAKAEETEDASAKAMEEAEAKAKEEAEAKAKTDAEARAKKDAEAKAREEAEEKAKEEAEAKAKEEADMKAKEEAEQKAKEEAELEAKEKAEAEAKEEVESKAKDREGAAAKDSEDAERKAKEESAGQEPLSRESTRSPSATEMVGSSVSVKCETSFGECVAMVGSTQALGAWDPSKALRLTTAASSYPMWTAQLAECLAVGTEFKFVILQGDGSAKWEPIPGNRAWPDHNLSAGPVGVSARFGEEPMTTSSQ